MTQTEPFSFYHSYKQIPSQQWGNVLGGNSIFLSLPYLKALEDSLMHDIQFIYVMIQDAKDSPLLIGVFQLATFTYKKGKQTNLLLKLFQDCKNNDDSVSINGMVCGNIFATGCHGFVHCNSISFSAATELMASAAKQLQEQKKYDDAFSIQLFKDFDAGSVKETQVLEDFKYRDFQADVSMVLPIRLSWSNFPQYLESMKAKYRTKANSAFKKSVNLVLISLSTSEIEVHQETLQQLYNNVQEKSDYHYGDRYPQAFTMLKKQLDNKFICKAAFLNEKLIGFSTAFVNGTTLEASYVGLDYGYNTSHALYERLLYGYVEDAIALQCKTLHLGRTSELIKSALGATPQEMTLYIKHRSKLKNVLLKPIVDTISPNEYTLRKPFKAAYYNV